MLSFPYNFLPAPLLIFFSSDLFYDVFLELVFFVVFSFCFVLFCFSVFVVGFYCEVLCLVLFLR